MIEFDDVIETMYRSLGIHEVVDAFNLPDIDNLRELVLDGESIILHSPCGWGMNVQLELVSVFPDNTPDLNRVSRGEVICILTENKDF